MSEKELADNTNIYTQLAYFLATVFIMCAWFSITLWFIENQVKQSEARQCTEQSK